MPRSAPHFRRGALPSRGPERPMGPGSAEQRYTLHRVRETKRRLHIHEHHRIGDSGSRGAVAIGLVIAVGISERNAADHPPVVAKPKMLAHYIGVECQCGLRDRCHAQRLRRQHEARDIAAAIDRAVDAERLVGMNDGNVRRAEEVEILQRLPGVGRLVAPGNAERVVKLKAAFAAALQLDAAIFARKREVTGIRPAARSGRIHHIAESLRCRA